MLPELLAQQASPRGSALVLRGHGAPDKSKELTILRVVMLQSLVDPPELQGAQGFPARLVEEPEIPRQSTLTAPESPLGNGCRSALRERT